MTNNMQAVLVVTYVDNKKKAIIFLFLLWENEISKILSLQSNCQKRTWSLLAMKNTFHKLRQQEFICFGENELFSFVIMLLKERILFASFQYSKDPQKLIFFSLVHKLKYFYGFEQRGFPWNLITFKFFLPRSQHV